MISLGYSGKRKQSRAETQLRKKLKQAQADLLDTQTALAEAQTTNTQRILDLEEVVAGIGGNA